MKAKVIMQLGLTPECFMVQLWGIEACNGCGARNKKTCGGKNILAKIEAGTFPKDGLPSCSPPSRVLRVAKSRESESGEMTIERRFQK